MQLIDRNMRGNKTGKTLLHFFAQEGNLHEMKILLSCDNIDINAQDKEGKTPLLATILNQDITSTLFLLKNGANSTLGNPPPEDYLVRFIGGTPAHKKVVENYKFFAPIHSTILGARLRPVLLQQQLYKEVKAINTIRFNKFDKI